jgi:hypothetical protein
MYKISGRNRRSNTVVEIVHYTSLKISLPFLLLMITYRFCSAFWFLFRFRLTCASSQLSNFFFFSVSHIACLARLESVILGRTFFVISHLPVPVDSICSGDSLLPC